MKFIGVLVLLAAAAIFGPGLLENTGGNSCSALEKKLIALASGASGKQQDAAARAFLMSMLQGASNGRLAEALMQQKFPNIPVMLSCPLGYWRVLVEPPTEEELRRLIRRS